MERIINLPGELVSSVVSVWLDGWKDVAHIDSAFCNRQDGTVWLEVVAERCIFRIVNLRGDMNANMVKWFLSRRILTEQFYGDHFAVPNCEFTRLLAEWFVQCGSMIRHLALSHAQNGSLLEGMVHSCVNLVTLNLMYCEWEDAWINIIRDCSNSLVKLIMPLNLDRRLGYLSTQREIFHAAPLTLPKLTKLALDASWFDCVMSVPALESLCVYAEYSKMRIDFRDCCNLVHSDLKDAEVSGDEFCQLMMSLKQGLRCLVCSYNASYTDETLASITLHHAHSLRFLHISSYSMDTPVRDIASVVNSCPHLHTFSTDGYNDIRTINNSSIVTLHVKLWTMGGRKDTDTLRIIATNFPQITTLWVDGSDCFRAVRGMKKLLSVCTQMHTLRISMSPFDKFSKSDVVREARGLKVVFTGQFNVLDYEDNSF